jgi:hypothetical protein
MGFGEGDFTRRRILEVVGEVEDGERDRIPCGTPAQLLLDVFGLCR